MLIVVSRMPHLGGVEYIETSCVVRLVPLDYVGTDGTLLEGCQIHLTTGATVESSDPCENIAEQIEFDEETEVEK